jgi:hypothetical protein
MASFLDDPIGRRYRVATLLYSAAMSLDGFIAGPGSDMSWLTPYLGPNPTVDALIPRIEALLVGNRTFRGDDPHKGTSVEGEPFGGGWTGPQFVLTHHPPAEQVPGVTFVGDLDEAVAAAKAAAGHGYLNRPRGRCGATVPRRRPPRRDPWSPSFRSCSATAYGCSAAGGRASSSNPSA